MCLINTQPVFTAGTAGIYLQAAGTARAEVSENQSAAFGSTVGYHGHIRIIGSLAAPSGLLHHDWSHSCRWWSPLLD